MTGLAKNIVRTLRCPHVRVGCLWILGRGGTRRCPEATDKTPLSKNRTDWPDPQKQKNKVCVQTYQTPKNKKTRYNTEIRRFTDGSCTVSQLLRMHKCNLYDMQETDTRRRKLEIKNIQAQLTG